MVHMNHSGLQVWSISRYEPLLRGQGGVEGGRGPGHRVIFLSILLTFSSCRTEGLGSPPASTLQLQWILINLHDPEHQFFWELWYSGILK